MKNIPLKNGLIRCCVAGILLSVTACKTVDDVVNPKMPEATQEGKRTFGCLIDGKLWLPYNPDRSSLLPADYEIRTNSFPVNAPVFTVNVKNLRQDPVPVVNFLTLDVHSTTAIAPGVYTLSNGFTASASLGLDGYSTANAGSGTLTITKVEPYTRTVNGITSRQSIVSGTFDFTAKTSTGKTITVTSGRFDLAPEQ